MTKSFRQLTMLPVNWGFKLSNVTLCDRKGKIKQGGFVTMLLGKKILIFTLSLWKKFFTILHSSGHCTTWQSWGKAQQRYQGAAGSGGCNKKTCEVGQVMDMHTIPTIKRTFAYTKFPEWWSLTSNKAAVQMTHIEVPGAHMQKKEAEVEAL